MILVRIWIHTLQAFIQYIKFPFPQQKMFIIFS